MRLLPSYAKSLNCSKSLGYFEFSVEILIYLLFQDLKKYIFFVIFSPPPGCLQFHTGIDGRFTTFNWNNPTTAQITHLRSQNYRICMRQEEGT